MHSPADLCSPRTRLRRRRLRGCWQQAAFDQHRRAPMVGVQLIVVGPADHVAIMPFAGADLNAERQTIVVETCRKADGWYAKYVYPAGGTVRPLTQAAILRHGLINGGHLDCGIDESVKVQAIQLRFVHGERLAARTPES